MNYQSHRKPKYNFLCRVDTENYDYLCRLAHFNSLSLARMLNLLIEQHRESGIKRQSPDKSHATNGSCLTSQLHQHQ